MEKKSSNHYKKLNIFLVIVTIISILYAIVTCTSYGMKLKTLNSQCEKEKNRYSENLKEEKMINEYTDSQIKEMAEAKAREDGYSYPGEKIFFDIK